MLAGEVIDEEYDSLTMEAYKLGGQKLQSIAFCTGMYKVASVLYTMQRKIERSSRCVLHISVGDSHNL